MGVVNLPRRMMKAARIMRAREYAADLDALIEVVRAIGEAAEVLAEVLTATLSAWEGVEPVVRREPLSGTVARPFRGGGCGDA